MPCFQGTGRTRSTVCFPDSLSIVVPVAIACAFSLTAPAAIMITRESDLPRLSMLLTAVGIWTSVSPPVCSEGVATDLANMAADSVPAQEPDQSAVRCALERDPHTGHRSIHHPCFLPRVRLVSVFISHRFEVKISRAESHPTNTTQIRAILSRGSLRKLAPSIHQPGHSCRCVIDDMAIHTLPSSPSPIPFSPPTVASPPPTTSRLNIAALEAGVPR